jgi:phosphoinositide-3-kinase regulatory subunit
VLIIESANDKQAIHQMMKLVHDLPEHHSQTLVHIMKHLIRICRMQYQRGLKDQPIILIQVWCHIIMRPPWEKIVYVFCSFLI